MAAAIDDAILQRLCRTIHAACGQESDFILIVLKPDGDGSHVTHASNLADDEKLAVICALADVIKDGWPSDSTPGRVN